MVCSVCSCAAKTEYTKIISSEERIKIEGVSVLPPKGEGWYFRKVHPGHIQIGKLGDTKDQSVGGIITLSKLPDIKTKEEFLALISEQRSRGKTNSRFKNILNKEALSNERNDFCVRFHTVYKDFGAKNLPLTSDYLIVEDIGINCRHPYNENIAVTIAFSQRTLENNKIKNFESIANNFIQNTIFISFTNANSKRGYKLLQEKKYAQAIKYLNLAITENPKDISAYNFRGSAYEKQFKYTQAMQDFNKAIDINPKQALAYYNRGVVYARQSKNVQAIQDFNRAISLNPKNDWAYYNRAVIYEKQFKYTKAIQDFRKVVEINPKQATAHNNIGWIYATCKNESLRNGAKAVSFALKAVNLQEDVANLDTLGAAYVENKQYEKAFETYKRVVKKDKSFIKNYQKSLRAKDYYSGPVNGIYNQKFERALRTCVIQGDYL
jgi:tetratricopeptide (TPR) repeat protein